LFIHAIQRHWQHEGTIKNEQSRDIAILETQDTGRRLTNHKNTKQQRKPKCKQNLLFENFGGNLINKK
jgi:hypothetical protein